MELRDDKDGWNLRMREGLVQLIQIDFRIGLLLSDSSGQAQLHIETPCRLKSPEADLVLTPTNSLSLAPLLGLFNSAVNSLVIKKTGQLTIEFDRYRTLEVDPSGAYEAWQLGCSNGIMLVCSPGGKVAVFRQPARADKGT